MSEFNVQGLRPYIWSSGILAPRADYRIICRGELRSKEVNHLIRQLELTRDVLLEDEATEAAMRSGIETLEGGCVTTEIRAGVSHEQEG